MPYGYSGRILRVDLGDRRMQVESPPEEFYRMYFGGRGIVSYYLLHEVPPNVEPFSPENVVVFSAGPLCGVPIAGSSRSSVGAKSPLTGGYGDGEMGGYWGVELKRAGFDAILVKGRAENPVYLLVNDGTVEIRNATQLWGRTTGETEALIREELGDQKVRVAAIGPAGEKLVRYACVVSDRRYVVGRGGIGAVMGSKNLKAVAVRGTGQPAVARPERLRELSRWMSENYMSLRGDMYELGTSWVVLTHNVLGGLPTCNFTQGSFEGAHRISGEHMKETVLIGRHTCFGCPISCKRVVELADLDSSYGGPEYETLAALGSCCGIDSLEALCRAHVFCNAMGVDTISAGVTLACAMECVARGLLGPAELGSLDLRFGNEDAMLHALELVVNRKGIGDDLAEGAWRFARRVGREASRYAMCVKRQEIPMHEPRLKPGLGIGYAVSPTGADHCHNFHDTVYSNPRSREVREIASLGILGSVPLGSLGPEKVRLAHHVIIWRTFLNCAPLCIFVPWGYNQVVEIIRAVTGWDTSLYELMKVGERCVQLPRVFNVREGFTVDDDVLPSRFMEPLPPAFAGGSTITWESFVQARAAYYAMVGWDDGGVPRKEKLEELGIGWAWEKL